MRRSLLLSSVILLFLFVGTLAAPTAAAATSFEHPSQVKLAPTRQVVPRVPLAPTLDARIIYNARDYFVVDVRGRGYGRYQMVGLVVKHNGHPQQIRPWYTRANERGAIYARIYVHSRIHHAWFQCEAHSRYNTGYAYVYRR